MQAFPYMYKKSCSMKVSEIPVMLQDFYVFTVNKEKPNLCLFSGNRSSDKIAYGSNYKSNADPLGGG